MSSFAGRASLHVFSCTPLDEGQSRDGHVTTSCVLELSRRCTEVLNVFDGSKDGQQQVYVVSGGGGGGEEGGRDGGRGGGRERGRGRKEGGRGSRVLAKACFFGEFSLICLQWNAKNVKNALMY